MDVARPGGKKRKQRQLVVGIAAVICVLGVLVVTAAKLSPASPAVRTADVQIGVVKRGELLRMIGGPGKLVPSQMRWVIARTDARVERVLAQPGAHVTADTAILELSNPKVEDDLQSAESAYLAAKADDEAKAAQMRVDTLALQSSLAEIRGQFESTAVQEEAERIGLEKGVIAAIQHKKTAIELAQLRSRLQIEEQRVAQSKENMRAQLAAGKARLNQLARTRELRQHEAAELVVRAGLDGVLQRISVDEGQRVNAGQNLARVAQPSTLVAELKIMEMQTADLAVGQIALIDLGNETIPGRVRRINPEVENGAIVVEVAFSKPLPAGVRTDQSVDGSIDIDRLPDVLYVTRPVNAIAGSRGTVFRLLGNGEAERVPVVFGKDSMSQIQILEGLKVGDKIIVSDVSANNNDIKLRLE